MIGLMNENLFKKYEKKRDYTELEKSIYLISLQGKV